MKTLPIVKILFLSVILITFFSCTKNLSREQAESLINEFQEFIQIGNSPNANSNALHDGYEQGYWDNNGNQTNDGFKYFSNSISYGRLFLKQPIKPKVTKVNGIVDAISPLGGEQKGVKEVQFQWEFTNAEGVVKRFVARGGTGIAYIRLYDDGWRVEKIEIQQNNLGFTLSSSERAEVEKDVQKENERRIEEARLMAEQNRIIREAQERRARLIQQSKSQNQTVGTFKDVDDFLGNPRSRSTILTDVNIDKVASSYDGGLNLWFGDIKGVPVKSNYRQTAKRWDGYCVIFNNANYYKVVFRDESECDKFYQALLKALSNWREKYSELQ